eukprot:scaffold7833_cov58-Skeletonema_marinoi.AAC.1
MESPRVVIRVAREGRSVGAGMATAFPSLLMVLAVTILLHAKVKKDEILRSDGGQEAKIKPVQNNSGLAEVP